MMNDEQFLDVCNANGFGAAARGEFPAVSRGMLRTLLDAVEAAERERWALLARAMHCADNDYGTGYYGQAEWIAAYKELRRMAGMGERAFV